MKLDNNNRSSFLLHYTLILCTMNRKEVITEDISNRLREQFEIIAPRFAIEIEEWDYKPDYVRVLIKGEPKTEMSKFIAAYKTSSSRHVKQEFPEIKPNLYKETFWSQNYCLLTVGRATEDDIEAYLKAQCGD